MTRQLYLGVDGGGTGCRARIEDGDGIVYGQGIAGPATTRLGIEAAWASVAKATGQAIAEAALSPDEVKTLIAGIGLAGVGRAGAMAALAAIPHGFASICFISDGLAACLGAHSGLDGGIVIAGTGSIGLGRLNRQEVRVGGYGFPISDEGSGADLGLKVVRLALQAYDGRAQATALTHEVMTRFGDDPMKAVGWMDKATATDYATFAPMVMRHADNGDPAGRRLVQSAAEAIDGLVRALVERGLTRISLLGGLSTPLEAWLSPDVRRRVKPADGDAVSGAIIAARESQAA